MPLYDSNGKKIFEVMQPVFHAEQLDNKLKIILGAAWQVISPFFSSGSDEFLSRSRYSDFYIDLDGVAKKSLDDANECMNKRFYQENLAFYANKIFQLTEGPTTTFYNYLVNSSAPIRRVLLVGCPGVGKTSFIRHIRTKIERNSDEILFLELELNDLRASRIRERFFDELAAALQSTNQTKKSEEDLITQLLSMPPQQSIYIAFDNIDKWASPEEQRDAIHEINELYSRLQKRINDYNKPTPALTFIAVMRRMTLARFISPHDFNRANDIDIYLLPSPPLSDVISKRVQYIQKSKGDIVNRLSPIDVELDHRQFKLPIKIKPEQQIQLLCDYFRWLHKDTHNYLVTASLGNIRASRNILIRHLFSFKTDETHLFYYVLQKLGVGLAPSQYSYSNYNPKLYRHDLLRSIYAMSEVELRSLTEFFSAEKVYSIQDCSTPDSLLVKTRIYQAINHIDNNLAGSQGPKISDVISCVAQLGYATDLIISAIRSLLVNRLLATKDMEPGTIHREQTDTVFVSAVGKSFFDNLFYDLGYLEATLGFIPFLQKTTNDLKRPNVFVKCAEIVQLIAAAESIEEKRCKTSLGAFDALQRVTNGNKIHSILRSSIYATFDAIEKSHSTESIYRDDYKQAIFKARSLLNSLESFLVLLNDKPLPLQCMPSEIARNYIRRYTSPLGAVMSNSSVEKLCNIEPILLAAGYRRSTVIGAELFFKADEVRAGAIFSGISHDPALAASFDLVAIRTLLALAPDIKIKNKLAFATINISKALFENYAMLSEVTEKVSLSNWMVMELPDATNDLLSFELCEKTFLTTQQLAIDDLFGQSNSTATYFQSGEKLSLCKLIKIDHVFFHANFSNNKSSLREIIIRLLEKCKRLDQFLVIEGIESLDHLKYLYEIDKFHYQKYKDNRLCAQGYYINAHYRIIN